jgi:penicillin-binding protein 1A
MPPRQAAKRRGNKPIETEVVGGRLWRIRRWLFVFVLLVCGATAAGAYLLSRIPLPSAKPLKQTTFVYDASGQHVLATLSEENRVDVTLSQVPPVAINAVVSTEDRHYFTEGALDPVGIIRATISDLTGSGSLQGASTITQQYVKQTYLNSQRSLTRKIKEAALAIRLSRAESKNQILQDYLNTIYWGRGAYGIEAASRAYFGRDVGQLTLADASLLAALIREPDTADPARNPSLARVNQTDTLKAMVRDKKITEAQAAAVEGTPFSGYVIPPTASSGIVTSAAAGDAYFVDAVRQELYAKYGSQVVNSDGLRVYTTLDPTLQTQAYNAVYGPGALNPARGGPSGALVSMDDNGEVKALVGGQGYTGSGGSAVDLALGAAGGGSGRQAGSTFKAFMLAYLLKEGYSPFSVFPAPPEVVIPHGNANGTPWSVTNFEHEVTAPTLDIVDATADSVNTVYAQVVDRLGASNLVAMAEQLGINPSELGDYPSEVLGTSAVSPLEMTAAYATFADNGVYHSPILITRVTTTSGENLPLPVQPLRRVVLSPSEAAQETYILQQVVLRGTGEAAGGVGTPVAGKTGTTENSADAWFIGYTPKLTTAVWLGFASGEVPMGQVEGGSIPAELWHSYMTAALRSEPQYDGQFPTNYEFNQQTLTPPPASTLEFPLGLGTTTTTAPPTTTTVPSTSTTSPGRTTTTTSPSTPPTRAPTSTPVPSTTAPSPATVPHSSPTAASRSSPGTG